MLSKYQSIFSFALCSALCTVALAKPHPQHGGWHGHGGGNGPAAPVAAATAATSVAAAASPAADSGTSGTTTTSSSGAVSGKGLIYYTDNSPPLAAYDAADLAFSLDWSDAAAADGASLGTFVPMCSGIPGKSLCLGNGAQSC